MFKYSKLILVVLICLVTFSIGYALLSSNIKVTGTANIPEIDMDLSISCGVITSDDPIATVSDSKGSYPNTSSSGHEDEEVSCSGLTGSYSVNFTIPNAYQSFWYEVTNNSSFSVRLKNVNIVSSNDSESQTLVTYRILDGKRNELLPNNFSSKALASGNSVSGTGEIKCKSGGVCELYPQSSYTIILTEYAPTGENNILNASVNRTFEFLFEQYND